MNLVKGFLKIKVCCIHWTSFAHEPFDTVIEQQQVIEAGFSLMEGMLTLPNRLC